MKKTFLSVLTILLFSILGVSAADMATTNATDTKTTKPNFEKMGPPPDGNFANRPAPPDGDFNGGQRPSKKPDAKPGGDRVPPEFMQKSNTSTTTSTNK